MVGGQSLLHTVVGMLVADGRLELDAPAPVPPWRGPGDPRGSITLQHLLAIRDGLAWVEEYEDPESSDVLQMLYGRGEVDMAAFAADRSLAAPPGTRFQYSTGTSVIISGIVARELGAGEPYRRFLSDRLFDPACMRSTTAVFDPAGAWVAGSYIYATAHDYRASPCFTCGTASGSHSACFPRAGSTTVGGPGRSIRTTATSTAPTGGPATSHSAPSGPPGTMASTSTSAPPSIWSWSGWAGPTPSTARCCGGGGTRSSTRSGGRGRSDRRGGSPTARAPVSDQSTATLAALARLA